jgi:hypothetical protein
VHIHRFFLFYYGIYRFKMLLRSWKSSTRIIYRYINTFMCIYIYIYTFIYWYIYIYICKYIYISNTPSDGNMSDLFVSILFKSVYIYIHIPYKHVYICRNTSRTFWWQYIRFICIYITQILIICVHNLPIIS